MIKFKKYSHTKINKNIYKIHLIMFFMSKNKDFSANWSLIYLIFFGINICKVFQKCAVFGESNLNSSFFVNCLQLITTFKLFTQIRTRSLIFLNKHTYDHYSLLHNVDRIDSGFFKNFLYFNSKHSSFIKNLSIFFKCNLSQFLTFFSKKISKNRDFNLNYAYILNLISQINYRIWELNWPGLAKISYNINSLLSNGLINTHQICKFCWFYLTFYLNLSTHISNFHKVMYKMFNMIKSKTVLNKKKFKKLNQLFFNPFFICNSLSINNGLPYILKYIQSLKGFFCINKNIKFSLIDLLNLNTYTSIFAFYTFDIICTSQNLLTDWSSILEIVHGRKFITLSVLVDVFNSLYVQHVPLYVFSDSKYASGINVILHIRTLFLVLNKTGAVISKTIKFSLKSKRNNSTISLSTGSGFNFITSSTGVLVSESFLDSKIGSFNNDMPIIALTKITKRSGTLNRSGYMFAGLVRLISRLFWIQDKLHYLNIGKQICDSCHSKKSLNILPYVFFNSNRFQPFYFNLNLWINKNKFMFIFIIIFFIKIKHKPKPNIRKNLKAYRFLRYLFHLSNYSTYNPNLSNPTAKHNNSINVCAVYDKSFDYNVQTYNHTLLRVLNKKFSTFNVRYFKTRFRLRRFRRKYIYFPRSFFWFKFVQIKFQSPVQNNVVQSNNISKFKRFFKRNYMSNDKLASSVRQIVNLFYKTHIIIGLSSKNLFPYNREYRFKKYKFRKRKVKRFKYF